VLIAGLGLAGVACSDDPAPAPAAPRAAATGPTVAPTSASEGEVVDAVYRYDPTGKRDPFRSFVRSFVPDDSVQTPLERFDLSQLTVIGIVWNTEGPRALVRDPAGKGYIVVVGSVMGKNKGRIVSIEDNVVLVKETYVDALNRAATKNVEMRLREAQGG